MRPSLRDRMTSQVQLYISGRTSWWRSSDYELREVDVTRFSTAIAAIDGDLEAHLAAVERCIAQLRTDSSAHSSTALERLLSTLNEMVATEKAHHALMLRPAAPKAKPSLRAVPVASIPLPVSPRHEGAVESKTAAEFKPTRDAELLTPAGIKAFIQQDYYQRLSLSDDASAADIKQHYRALARIYHPDKNGTNQSAKHAFAAISEAYECLQDPMSRINYDRDLIIERMNPSAFADKRQQRFNKYVPNPKVIGPMAAAAVTALAAASAKRPGTTAAVVAAAVAVGVALFARRGGRSLEDGTSADATMPGGAGFTM